VTVDRGLLVNGLAAKCCETDQARPVLKQGPGVRRLHEPIRCRAASCCHRKGNVTLPLLPVRWELLQTGFGFGAQADAKEVKEDTQDGEGGYGEDHPH
jgi:hypothetical protein